MNINKFMSRKLWLSVLVIGVACWAVSKSYVDGPQFVTLLLASLGAYTYANLKQQG